MFNLRPMPRRVLGGLGNPSQPSQRPLINPGQPPANPQIGLAGNVPAGSPTVGMGIDEGVAGQGSEVMLPGQGQPGSPVLQQQAIQALLSKAAQSQAGQAKARMTVQNPSTQAADQDQS